jgi:hypothetical protein
VEVWPSEPILTLTACGEVSLLSLAYISVKGRLSSLT